MEEEKKMSKREKKNIRRGNIHTTLSIQLKKPENGKNWIGTFNKYDES